VMVLQMLLNGTLQSMKDPQLQYWNTTLQLELMVLQLVRAAGLANFDLYVISLQNLAPWFFLMGHINYAHWVSVHLHDMHAFLQMHPAIASEFRSGKFTVHKTTRKFSAIALDQAHEQLNATVKSNGGAIGLTDDLTALLR
jgi:hypothetical protein